MRRSTIDEQIGEIKKKRKKKKLTITENMKLKAAKVNYEYICTNQQPITTMKERGSCPLKYKKTATIS